MGFENKSKSEGYLKPKTWRFDWIFGITIFCIGITSLIYVLFEKRNPAPDTLDLMHEAGDRRASSYSRSLQIAGELYSLQRSPKTEAQIRRFLAPVQTFLRREAQFPELRNQDEEGCLLVAMRCRAATAKMEEFYGESSFGSKYEISLSLYGALGAALDHFMMTNKGAGLHQALQICTVPQEGGVVLLNRARCDVNGQLTHSGQGQEPKF